MIFRFPQIEKCKPFIEQDSQAENFTDEIESRKIVENSLKEFPKLLLILNEFFDDENHSLNIISSLKNRETRERVLKLLTQLAHSVDADVAMNEDAYRKFVDDNSGALEMFFRNDDDELSLIEIGGEKRKKKDVLRETLLAEKPLLYSTADILSQEQWLLLEEYVAFLRNDVSPSFQEKLEEII